jgi:hypothetical protein
MLKINFIPDKLQKMQPIQNVEWCCEFSIRRFGSFYAIMYAQ